MTCRRSLLKKIISVKGLILLLLSVFVSAASVPDSAEAKAAEWLKQNGSSLETDTIAASDGTWTEGVIT